MKIKVDFVTNSSSSAYVLMGSYITPNDIDKNRMKEIMEKKNMTEEEIVEEFHECIEYFIEGTELTHSFGPYYDYDDNAAVGICV